LWKTFSTPAFCGIIYPEFPELPGRIPVTGPGILILFFPEEVMDSFEEIFGSVSDYCRTQMTEVAHNLWIRDIVPLGLENDVARLGVNSEFKQNLVSEKYSDLLKRGFEQALGFPVSVRIECVNPAEAPKPAAPKPISDAGDYDYTFDTFIVGSSNKFAHAAAMAVATHEASNYNPLFIYGESGLGKTHLLFAIRNEVQRRRLDAVVIYVKGEEFTNELIEALRRQNTAEFHNKYRKADYLLVDDIQFIAGKDSTQEEFFHTFNTLYESGKQIVLASDRPPKEIKTLEERLRTRFEMGLIADIHAPDFETRIAIIQRKAERLGIEIPNDVVEYIAGRLKSNIRQLEGAVRNLQANGLISDVPPTILTAQNAIRDILNDNRPVPVTIDRIISEVARTYSVSPQDIKSNKRAANISKARQIAIYIVREITQMSMAAIGEEFGGRDHSTIVYAISQVDQNMAHDSRYRETVEDITKNIRDN